MPLGSSYRDVAVGLALLLVGSCFSPCGDAVAASEPNEIDRSAYTDRLHGFWLGQSIANWTGLTTEMVKVEPPFYTDADWGKAADRNIWGNYPFHSGKIDFYLVPEGRVWGADDDTDIEYMYLHLTQNSETGMLTAEQIRAGWLKHIYSNSDAPLSPISFERENFLWVSNERARDLMAENGLAPPHTSDPANNQFGDMIDAQLTTEIFGLFAPGSPAAALRLAELPISVSANNDAADIARFYVVMHSLASMVDPSLSAAEQTRWLAHQARTFLPQDGYPAKMFDFVLDDYHTNPDKTDWERTRDAVYERYQKSSSDGYTYKGGFDAGINFAASLISLLYGAGDFESTVRIGTLAGWDSDNPTATWGGLLGFLKGKAALESLFQNVSLSEAYWIHRTRRNFPDLTPDSIGEDTFSLMAKRGVGQVDKVMLRHAIGAICGQVWRLGTTSCAGERD